VKIEVIQGGIARARREDQLPPIRMESTGETGLRHLNGVLSIARAGPDTGRAEFFICIGDQPELDQGGRRNPDGWGFAAFGRVIGGMDVVRRIQTRGPRLGNLNGGPCRMDAAPSSARLRKDSGCLEYPRLGWRQGSGYSVTRLLALSGCPCCPGIHWVT